jgi:hypothetical protein
MNLSPQAAADLATLSRTIDDPEIDLLRMLTQLTRQIRRAVPSYLGVSISMTTSPSHVITIDVMEDTSGPTAIGSSLKLPAPVAMADVRGRPGPHQDITLVLYAGRPGALVDLAADLGWLTGLALEDFVLDQHLVGPQGSTGTLSAASLADQAVGVLLGQGHTPEQALRILDGRAVTDGISYQVAAEAILDELAGPVEPTHDSPL